VVRLNRVWPRVTIRLLALLFLTTAVALGPNSPPAAPVIVEPALDGQLLHPGDVHMATEPMVDPDPGDQHLCTEFEIWTVQPPERVWATACLAGIARVHTHIADGTFMGSLAGRLDFDPDTDYRLLIRHVDDSGDPATAAGPFAERLFRTRPASVILPLELDDIRADPTPRWVDSDGGEIVLPSGAPPPVLRIESPQGEPLLAVAGNDGTTNQLVEPGPLDQPAPLRLRLAAGSATQVTLPQSRIVFSGGDGEPHSIHLPALVLLAGLERYFWVSANGSSFVADANQTVPDFSVLAQSAAVPWAVRPGFAVEVVASGFELPVAIAFVPAPAPEPDAPLYYVAELHDGIKVVGRDGSVRDFATGLLNFDPLAAFPGAGETGIAGIAIDPESGDLFASYLYADPPGAPSPHYPIVVRFTSLDGGRTAVLPPVTVLDLFGEVQGASHQISNLSFGPDGMLYVHVGDGFEIQRALDLESFRGKILRLHPDGTPAADNPFYDEGDGISARNYVFAFGFRNPFGGVWREADGAHYEVENGPTVDRLARIDAGQDYGWAGSDADMALRAIHNWTPSSAPVNIAWIQPGTFGGSGFPAALMDRAYVSESGPTWANGPQLLGKRISEFVIDLDGALVSGPTPLVEYTGVGRATVAALAAGPDGLYFSDLYKDLDFVSAIDRGAHVLRVRFVGSADFGADPVEGLPPLAVQFTDASTVPDITAWLWSFGDGTTSTEQHPAHVYQATGHYDVRLHVTGSSGTSVVEKEHLVHAGPTCGDGIVSEGEECDGGGCCSDTCSLEPVGTPCDDGLVCTQEDTCAGGACGGAPVVCPDTEACQPTTCDEAALSCVVTEVLDAPCDDGNACTEDTCAGSTCGHEPISFAATDASFGTALAAPACEDERVTRRVERALMKARKRIALAAAAVGPRRTALLERAARILERAEKRMRRSRRVSAECAASVEAMLDALQVQAGCLRRDPPG
jgi:glucose/arabinose dehydrogenase